MKFVVLVQTLHGSRIEVFGPFEDKDAAQKFVAALEAQDYQRGDHVYTVSRLRNTDEVLP
jgi:hypothetical protein